MSQSVIWILGATGRTGRAVAARLVANGHRPVLVGRNATRLNKISESLGGGMIVLAAETLSEMTSLITKHRPTVVINTIGPFTQTAMVVAQACTDGTHYIDLSNELPSVLDILGLHERAVSKGITLVTGAGFGVLGTESVVLALCKDRPTALRVRCAAIPGVAVEPGPLGEAFALSITEGLATGGRRYENGKLVRVAALGDYEAVPLPDGKLVKTASAPSGELEAAKRASGAAFAVSASSMVPTAPFLRAILPTLLTVMKIGAVRRFVARRIAAIDVKPVAEVLPQISWSHARVEWSSGEVRQGWMRTSDAMVFTAEVMAQVAIRLANGDGRPGAYTPGALFGPELATACGGEIVIQARDSDA